MHRNVGAVLQPRNDRHSVDDNFEVRDRDAGFRGRFQCDRCRPDPYTHPGKLHGGRSSGNGDMGSGSEASE